MRTMFLTVILFATLSAFTMQEWVSLGSKKVNFKLDRDVVNVSYKDGTFTAVKFEVSDGSLNMHRCVVHFENGGKQEVELRHNFGKGSESRVVDLKGNRRFIEKIEFWYDSKNAQNKRATITVLGKK